MVGVVSTIAGCSERGYVDGPVESAAFQDLIGIAVDERDNSIYVTEATPRRLRRIKNGKLMEGGGGYPGRSCQPRDQNLHNIIPVVGAKSGLG